MYTTNKITHADVNIDPELEKLLCPLSEGEFKALEDSIFANGLQDAVKVWINPEDSKCYLVDGHNRYTIMDKYGKEIPQDKITVLDNERYKTKDDVMFYMLQYQLGRRNLADGQRAEYVLRYEEYFKKKGKQNQSAGGGDKKSVSPNLGKAIPKADKVNSDAEMAKMAGMSTEKFRQAKVVLKSDNEEVKERYKRDEMSTYKAYREVIGKDETKKLEPIKMPTDQELADLADVALETYCMGRMLLDSDNEELKQKLLSDEMTIDDGFKEFTGMELNLARSKPAPKIVADYDKEIADIEAEIAALYEMKTQLIQDRHKAFQADNSQLRCEYTVEHGSIWSYYSFYLVKGESRINLFKMSSSSFEKGEEELYKSIKSYLVNLHYNKETPNLSDEEKKYITAEIVGMKDQVKKEREVYRKREEDLDELLKRIFEEQQRRAKLGNNGHALNHTQLNDKEKEWVKRAYRAAAQAFHPDINPSEDATEAMQFINTLFKGSFGV